MSDQNISSELFSPPFNEQLFTDFTPEEAAIISGGQRARGFFRQGFQNKCSFFNEEVNRVGNKFFLTFTARCPIDIF